MKNHLPLKELQHKMLELIKGSYYPKPDDEAYFKKIYESENLELTKVIILWWRQNYIERYCSLTSSILIERNQLQAFTAQYFKLNNHSLAVEEMAIDFLQWIMQNGKGLIKMVARFEYGMIQLKKGNIYSDELIWPCDPSLVIQGLKDGNLTNIFLASGEYWMKISNKLQKGYVVEELLREVVA